MERRAAVIDLGSNSFRLVVFTWTADWWKRTDEIYEAVRIGEGLSETGVLQPEPMERALRTLELFGHFITAMDIEDVRPVATSAIREAGNQAEFLAAANERTALPIRVLSQEEEARYGYLAAVNSTTLADGIALDIGGGSMQLTRVADRLPVEMRSWRLGAVRMTERFLPGKRQTRKDVKALRAHVHKKLQTAPWITDGGRMVGVGGTVRNLAVAVQQLAGQPAFTVQGVEIRRDALGELIERLLELPAHERSKVHGIKPGRADIILAGAVVVDAAMEAGGFESLEATQAGLREGVFFESLMEGQEPPLIDDVRGSSVLNLAAQYHPERAHSEHVAELSLEMWDALAGAGRFDPAPGERGLIWAAAILHDVGTAVDYDDHHKHSRYLILNAGLPGYSARETALIAQMARYHRKGTPSMGELSPHALPGDEELLERGSAVLRIAEQLERSRDQVVQAAGLEFENGRADLLLEAKDDVTLARRSAEREAEIFERAFGVTLSVR
jgi:exopolyphosphatase/guanosine-5'-triphosphate,3'-diphosphate pyrophosphatase